MHSLAHAGPCNNGRERRVIFVAVLPLSPYGHFVYPDSALLWAWIVGHLMFGFGMWLVAWPRLFRAQA